MPRKGHLEQAAQDHTGMVFEDLQGGGSLHHLSEPPVPVTRKGQKHFLMVRGSPVAPPQLQQKGRITSLSLLAALLLMQSWISLLSVAKACIQLRVHEVMASDLTAGPALGKRLL